MNTTDYDYRTEAIEFAATYPTPNVRRAVEAAEAGLVTWEQVYNLFKRSLVMAVATV